MIPTSELPHPPLFTQSPRRLVFSETQRGQCVPPNSSKTHCSRSALISVHRAGNSPCLDSITVRRVRPSPASDATSLIFCTEVGVPTKVVSSVFKNPFLGRCIRVNSDVVCVRSLRDT